MARFTCMLVGIALLAGCAGQQQPEPKDLAADEMPISFSYGALNPVYARRQFVADPRRGNEVRRLTMAGGEEIAIFDVLSVYGDYGVTRKDTRFWIRNLVKDQGDLAWQESGRVGGARWTDLQTFAMPKKQAQCVGLQRSLKEHTEATPGDYSQALVIGFYCRRGDSPISLDEARTIAAAVQARD